MRIGVLGSAGKMGQELLALITKNPAITLSCALVRPLHPYIGQPLSVSDHLQQCNATASTVLYSADLEAGFQATDIMINFALPDDIESFLHMACKTNTGMVIGTTGFSDAAMRLIRQASNTIPILYASNMSMGIAVLSRLAELAAASLGQNFDVEILEMHHRHKKDIPSGTSLTLGRAVAKGRHACFEDVAVFNRQPGDKRQTGDIGFAALRAGNVFGDHHIVFASNDEVIELSHRALSRSVFAQGALNAAQWLFTQEPGFYSIQDVLNAGSDKA